MTMQEAAAFVTRELGAIYEDGEAGAISDWVIEYLTGTRKKARHDQNRLLLEPEQEGRLHAILGRLLQQEPVQYVLNEAWFCGLKFHVDNRVLIPRPETEELVEWVISHCKFPVSELAILDIGSGSGCIPVSLKRRLGKANVWGCDASPGALDVAKMNADHLGVEVNFMQLDFLDAGQTEQLPSFDFIVSNPPYIPVTDQGSMAPNVVEYEPHMALFVPDNDPLVFYRAIAAFGKTHLNKGGSLFFEIHEDLGNEVRKLLESEGYSVTLKKDMQGKERMAKGERNVGF